MIKPKKHNCKVCGEETWGRECNKCKAKRYRKTSLERNKNKSKKPLSNKRKPTGELDLFKEIWEERPHISEISGEPLREFDVRYFSHILPKSTFPLYRLRKENILLKTPEEHNAWQFKQHTLKGNIKWKFVFLLKLELTQNYYKEFYGKEYN